MNTYKIVNSFGQDFVLKNNLTMIPFVIENTDYQQFKQAINDDTAQLEDAEGNLMTAEEAKTFVATLP